MEGAVKALEDSGQEARQVNSRKVRGGAVGPRGLRPLTRPPLPLVLGARGAALCPNAWQPTSPAMWWRRWCACPHSAA